MKKSILVSLLILFSLSGISRADNTPTLLWSCSFPDTSIQGGSGSLENINLYKTSNGIEADLAYNRPFDDEAAYPVMVTESADHFDFVFHGEAKSDTKLDGFLYLTIHVHGETASGQFSARIPSSADSYYGMDESFKNVLVTCSHQEQ